jgi:hypothetical protein
MFIQVPELSMSLVGPALTTISIVFPALSRSSNTSYFIFSRYLECKVDQNILNSKFRGKCDTDNLRFPQLKGKLIYLKIQFENVMKQLL